MTVNTGTPPEGTNTSASRDGEPGQAARTEESRNATNDESRNAASGEGDDDLETVDDPKRLREMLREMRGHERRRNEGYNTVKRERDDFERRLAAIERERAQGAPVEQRMAQLEADIKSRDEKITRMEKERKDERTDGDIAKAARALNAADPDDVVRLIDRDDLTIDDDGRVSNAESVVRTFLRKKPHLVKAGGGAADGGARGQSGRGSSTDMNDLLRGARRRGTVVETTDK